jgi:hypothetical protein
MKITLFCPDCQTPLPFNVPDDCKEYGAVHCKTRTVWKAPVKEEKQETATLHVKGKQEPETKPLDFEKPKLPASTTGGTTAPKYPARDAASATKA